MCSKERVRVDGPARAKNWWSGAVAVAAIVLSLAAGIATTKTFGQTIINVPPETAPWSIGRDTTLNLFGGGILPTSFKTKFGSAVHIRGGSIGDSFTTLPGSAVNIHGVDFALDGIGLTGLDAPGDTLSLNVPDGSEFTGTLADGTPFAFSSLDDWFWGDGDSLSDGTVTLIRSMTPAPGPEQIHVPEDVAPFGVRVGQTLTVEEGGTLPRNFSAGTGSIVNIHGGTVGFQFEAVGAEVNITSGEVGQSFDAFSGSTVNIHGGKVGAFFDAFGGSTVNITAGNVGGEFEAFGGSKINISGGSLGYDFKARSGSRVTISGGSLGDFNAFRDSEVEINGVEFSVDGIRLAGLETPGDSLALDLPHRSLLSGTLADGLPFAFWGSELPDLTDGMLKLVRSAEPSPGPALIELPADATPLGVGAGQTVTLRDGGALPANFTAGPGSIVNVTSGAVGENFEAVGAVVNFDGGFMRQGLEALLGSVINVSGGSIGSLAVARSGSTFNISGGTVELRFAAFADSVVNVSGGTLGFDSAAHAGAVFNITGGRIADSFDAYDGSTINIGGGTMGKFFMHSGANVNILGGNLEAAPQASPGSSMHLLGTEFLLDGVPILGLSEPGDSLVLADRGSWKELSGAFQDGTTFAFALSTINGDRRGFVSRDATLRLTVVPEPSTGFLLVIGTIGVVASRRRRRHARIGNCAD